MTWRRVDPYFARRIQLAIFAIAIGFGLDYLYTPTQKSIALTTIEQSWLPLWAWGATITAAGVAGLLVEWRVLGALHPFVLSDKRWKWGWVSNISHIVLFAMFTTLAGSALYDIAMRGLDGGGWFGWRTSLLWGGFAFGNFQYIRRLGDPR